MLRLRRAQRVACVHRAGEAQAAGELRSEVGQDVGVEVSGEHDVIVLGLAHQLRRHGIDDFLFQLHLRKFAGHFAGGLEEKAIGQAKDVRLVHRSHQVSSSS